MSCINQPRPATRRCDFKPGCPEKLSIEDKWRKRLKNSRAQFMIEELESRGYKVSK